MLPRDVPKKRGPGEPPARTSFALTPHPKKLAPSKECRAAVLLLPVLLLLLPVLLLPVLLLLPTVFSGHGVPRPSARSTRRTVRPHVALRVHSSLFPAPRFAPKEARRRPFSGVQQQQQQQRASHAMLEQCSSHVRRAAPRAAGGPVLPYPGSTRSPQPLAACRSTTSPAH